MKINNEIYNIQIELNYWQTYYSNLIDFVLYEKKLKDKELKKIHIELFNIQSHIIKIQQKIEKKLLKTHYHDSEKYFNLKQKKK